MCRRLVRTKQFVKDYKRLKFSDKHYSKFIIYLAKLLNGEVLPLEAKDHALKGEWTDFRELHISGDLLLIYKVVDDIVYLARIGSHSELFK